MGGAERVGRRITSEVRWDQSHLIPVSSHQAPKRYLSSVSPQLEDNNTLKCSSDKFAKTLRYFFIMENCQNYISMYHCPPIPGRSSLIALKLCPSRDRICMLFRTFSPNWRTMVHWNIVLTIFHYDQIYQGLWNFFQNYISTHCCPPIMGRLT